MRLVPSTADPAKDSGLVLGGIGYSYGSHPVLRSVDLEVAPGIAGIVGPNGAGKTTLLRLVAGIAEPREGYLSLDGRRIDGRKGRSQLRAQVGFLPQDPRWFGESSVEGMVSYFATSRLGRSAATRRAVAEAIEVVGLSDRSRSKLRELSGGQARRAFLAQALVHDPRVLVLDEPTAGLDPVQRVRLREHLLVASEGRIVIWATHVVGDLSAFAASVLVLDDGEVAWRGTPEELEVLGGDEAGTSGATAGERGLLRILGGTQREGGDS